jgi:hypothetical protein
MPGFQVLIFQEIFTTEKRNAQRQKQKSCCPVHFKRETFKITSLTNDKKDLERG